MAELLKEVPNTEANVLIRGVIAAAYCQIARGPEAVPVLISLLKDRNQEVRREAVGALGDVGPAAKAAAPDLIDMLAGGPAEVRRECAWSLGRIGPDARKAVPALTAALRDDDKWVRRHAADALRAIDPEAATKAGVR